MTLPTPRGSVVVYRTDGGATTSFGIVVRLQCTLIPGVLVVRELENRYPALEGRVEQLDSAKVRIIIPSYRDDGTPPPVDRTVDLGLLPCIWSWSG
jgi:hypothetical protein